MKGSPSAASQQSAQAAQASLAEQIRWLGPEPGRQTPTWSPRRTKQVKVLFVKVKVKVLGHFIFDLLVKGDKDYSKLIFFLLRYLSV